MDAVKEKDKRAHPRVSLESAVEFFTRGGLHQGEAVNISVGGMLIRTDELLEPDEPILVVFHLPTHNRPLNIKADVVWSSPGDTTGEEGTMGVKFDSAGREVRRRLTEFIASTQLTRSAW